MFVRVALVVGALLVSCAATSTALAHSDDGVFAGLDATPGTVSLEVQVRARLVYANDGDPAPGATVTVDALSADGVVAPAAALHDNGDGTYEGPLLLPTPGAWTIRFTATTPAAAGEMAYVAEPAPTTTSTTREPDLDASGDGGGGAVLLGVAGAGAAVLVLAAVVLLLVRRSRAGS
jgi:hypothetical protein